jgi:glutaminyl-tRNA synthetase
MDGAGTADQNGVTADTAGLDFIRAIIAEDNARGTYGGQVVTRFPPEPNGFLHIGHAKSICLNFGVAEENRGTTNLRFDDTNPTTEDVTYVEAIKEDIRWLGFEWNDGALHASDYFGLLYEMAEQLIAAGKAYVDSSSEEEIRAMRGTVTEPGTPSAHRDRPVEQNLDLFRRMRAGEFADGAHVLRAKIDLAHPNMKMRDPLLYRIRHAHHYRTGDDWCIYPMYDFAHPLSDAIEGITHSLCTLEFENNREIYDWLIDNVDVGSARPRQYEFARLNLDYTVMSKRKLLRLVEEEWVDGWDDPRMPTIAGMRRRGFTPASIRSFCDLIGVAKADSRVDISKLEYAIRDDLNPTAPRVMCVLRPLKVVITNYPAGADGGPADDGAAGDDGGPASDGAAGDDAGPASDGPAGDGAAAIEELEAPYFPRDIGKPGSRQVPFGRELFIERDDFMEEPPEGFFRLAPGREVRLRYAYFIKCEEVIKDDAGEVVELRCSYDPATRGGSAPDGRKVRGTIHWVDAERSLPVEVRLYDRLFSVADPDAAAAREGKDFTELLNPDSFATVHAARIEPALAGAAPGTHYQFERHGYFFTDPLDSEPDALVFNRVVTLRDTWAKIVAAGEAEPRDRERPEAGAAADGKRRRVKRSRSELRDEVRGANPELAARYERYQEDLGLSEEDADLLTGDPSVADLFEAALAAHDEPHSVANWVVNELAAHFDAGGVSHFPFGGAELGALVGMVDAGKISSAIAKELLAEMVERGGDPRHIVEERGLQQVDDPGAIEPIVERLIAAHPDKAEEYRNGRTGLAGFFVGQVMRATGGTANPELVQKLVRDKLARD